MIRALAPITKVSLRDLPEVVNTSPDVFCIFIGTGEENEDEDEDEDENWKLRREACREGLGVASVMLQ